MGFWERRERDQEFDLSMRDFGDFLIDLLLSPVTKIEERATVANIQAVNSNKHI
jgi:hypothetical protein